MISTKENIYREVPHNNADEVLTLYGIVGRLILVHDALDCLITKSLLDTIGT